DLEIQVGAQAGRPGMVQQSGQCLELQCGRGRSDFAVGPKEAQRRAQITQGGGRSLLDVLQRSGGVVRVREIERYTGSDVDRDERMRERVVKLASDPQALLGLTPPILLFAFARLALLSFAVRRTQCSAAADRVPDRERGED